MSNKGNCHVHVWDEGVFPDNSETLAKIPSESKQLFEFHRRLIGYYFDEYPRVSTNVCARILDRHTYIGQKAPNGCHEIFVSES